MLVTKKDLQESNDRIKDLEKQLRVVCQELGMKLEKRRVRYLGFSFYPRSAVTGWYVSRKLSWKPTLIEIINALLKELRITVEVKKEEEQVVARKVKK